MDKDSYLNFSGKKIWYRLAYPIEAKKYPSILFIHGSHFSTSFSFLIDQLKKDFVCLSFSHLGCGKSEGNFEEYSLYSRLKQSLFVLSYLKSLNIASSINVVGVSMGGHVAARLSEKENVEKLILRAPASYSKEYENHKMNPNPGWLPWDRKKKDWPWKPSYAFDAIEKFKGNLLIVKCEKDEIIPDKIIEEYYKKAVNARSKKLELLRGAKHYMSNQPELLFTFTSLIENFFKSRVK